MIVSNKFLRANYGKPLRDFLSNQATIKQIVDFAGLPVFPNATVRTLVILTAAHAENESPIIYSPPLPLDSFSSVQGGSLTVDEAIQDVAFEVAAQSLAQPVWSFSRKEIGQLFKKITAGFTPLNEYCDGKICMGIKSGLAEAFVIDEQTRSVILKNKPEAREIIKPFLNGRDVRRYYIDYKENYLIYTFHGFDLKGYPAVESYLEPFKERLEKRATQQNWYELQQPQYKYAEYMEAPKIIFPDICLLYT